MFARLRYYLRRALEAPPQIVLQKIAWKFKPYIFQPVYALSRRASRRLPSAEYAAQRSSAIKFGRSLVRQLRQQSAVDPEFAVRARRRAESALGRDVPCLGFGRTPIPHGQDWSADPFHKHQWPLGFFAYVNYLAPGVRTDVKIPWELSRFQYLVWLAEGIVFDPQHGDRYRDRFVQIVSDWMTNNPPGYGVNWTCPMEVGLRAINLSISFAIFAEDLDENTAATMIHCIASHGEFIARFPEKSDVPGNHFLADLAGEVFCGALAFAGTGFDRSVHAFVEEAERQFEVDGCQWERAPIYHRLCLDMVAIVLALTNRREHPCSARLRVILNRGVDFCRAIGSATCKLPIFGDCDSGQILLLQEDARDYSGLQQFAASLDGGILSVSSDPAHWLLALSGRDPPAPATSPELQAANRNAIATHDLSGFISARHGDLVAVMRVGAQGLKGRAPHDHDDALSIWLSKGGRDLLTEEACHSYTLDPAIRQRYIGSRAHNVLQPHDRERYAGVPGSIFRTVRGAPTAASWRCETKNGSAELRAALATPWRPGQPFDACQRIVTLTSPTKVEIEDIWSWAGGSHEAELNWHFGPGLRPNATAQGAEVRDERDAAAMSLTLESDLPLTIETFEYVYSPVYGAGETCWGVRVRCVPHVQGIVRSTFMVH